MKKQFKVIDNDFDFNKLLDDLGTRGVRHLYEKSRYEMYLEGLLENIKAMGDNIIMKTCIDKIINNPACELKTFYYNHNYICKQDLILKHFITLVYRNNDIDKVYGIDKDDSKYYYNFERGIIDTYYGTMFKYEENLLSNANDYDKKIIGKLYSELKYGDESVTKIALFIQLYIQNLIHINYIKNGDMDNGIDTLNILHFNNQGGLGKFPSKVNSCLAIPDIVDIINKYPIERGELGKCIFNFNRLEKSINVYSVMTRVNGVIINTLKKEGLILTKPLLTKLFLFYIKNIGELGQAFIHSNADSKKESYNNNMLYVYSNINKCYRYLDVEDKLKELVVKLMSIIPFANLEAKKDDEFYYNCTKSIATIVEKDLRSKHLSYKLRDKLNYTSFVVDNGTVVMNKITGEFIFCENLFSERIMCFNKFRGNFDKDFFVSHYDRLDNPLLKYTMAKIKNGLNDDGTVNKDVYGLLTASVLNLFQPDVETHNAVVLLGQHGTGKTLLINAIKRLDSLQINANFSREVGITEYMNAFLSRDLEKYHRTFKSEFSVKEYSDNSTIKVVLERGSILINQKFRDAVTVDINSKPIYTGEEFMRINVDGGLKDRFVLFEMRDKSKDTFFDIEGVDDIEDFLEYNVTHTLCGFYDGFMFQLDNKVFNSEGRVYSRLFMKYNPNTYNSFIERVSHIGGIDLILDIDENGILNQADLKNLVKICDECGYDTDIKKVARQTLSKNLNKLRDYNSQSRIFNGIDFKNAKESTLKKHNTTFKRQPYSLGIKFRDSVLDEIMSRLVNDKQRYRNQIKELEDIISRHNGYTKDDLRYIAKKYINDITIKDLDNDAIKDVPKSDIENTISEIQSIGLRKA